MATKYNKRRQRNQSRRKKSRKYKGGLMDDLPQETKDALNEKFVQGYKPRMDEIDSVLREYRIKGIQLSYKAYKDLMDYVLHVTGATKFEPKPKSQDELDYEVYLAEARKVDTPAKKLSEGYLSQDMGRYTRD